MTSIKVHSQAGIGVGCSMCLPVWQHILPEDPVETGLNQSLKEKRVLLMDDEKMIREVTGRILKHMGIGEVLIACDGEEALHIYNKSRFNGNLVDVVIMDLTISGGMGGKEALHEMLKIDPNIKAIVSSGYADGTILSDYRRYGFRGVLVKPYNIQELNRVLSEVITGQAQ